MSPHLGRGRALATRATLLGLLMASLASFVNPTGVSAVGLPGSFAPVAYARVLADTSLSAGQTKTFDILGVGGVPTSSVAAVVVDVSIVSTTATNSTAVQVWSSGTSMPSTATARANTATAPVSNTTVVAPGSDGKLAINNVNGTTVVNVDVQGYFAETTAGSTYVPMRQLAVNTNEGLGLAGPVAAGSTVEFSATAAGVPGGAQAVFANVVALAPSTNGALTMYASGTSAPTASTLSYSDDGSDSSGVMIPIGANGNIAVRNTSTSGSSLNLRIEIQGYMATGQSNNNFNLLAAPTSQTVGGMSAFSIPASSYVDVQVGGRNGIPTYGVAGAWLNVNAKDNTSGGNLTIYPKGQRAPSTGTVVLAPAANSGAGVSASTVVPTGFDGYIRVANSSTSAVTVTATLLGWFAGTRAVPAENETSFVEAAVAVGNSRQMANLAVWYEDVKSSLISTYSSQDEADPAIEPALESFADSSFTTDSDPDTATTTAGRSAATASCGGSYELGKYNRKVQAYNVAGDKLWDVRWISRWCGSLDENKVGAKGFFQVDPPEFTILGSIAYDYVSVTDNQPTYKTYNGFAKGGLKMARRQTLEYCAFKIPFCDDIYIRYWVQGNYDLSKLAGGTW